MVKNVDAPKDLYGKKLDGKKRGSVLSSTAVQSAQTSQAVMDVASVTNAQSNLAIPDTFANAESTQPIGEKKAQELCDKLEKLYSYCSRKNLSQKKFDRKRTEFYHIVKEEIQARDFSQNKEASDIRTKISGLVVSMSYLTDLFIEESDKRAVFASIAKMPVSLLHQQEKVIKHSPPIDSANPQQSVSHSDDAALFQARRAQMLVLSEEQLLESVNNVTEEFDKSIGEDNEAARRFYDDAISYLQARYADVPLPESISKQIAQMETKLILNGLFFDQAHKGFIPHLDDRAIRALPEQQMSHLIEHLFTAVAETIDNKANAKSIYQQTMNYIKKRYPAWPQNVPSETIEMHSDINAFAKLTGMSFDD